MDILYYTKTLLKKTYNQICFFSGISFLVSLLTRSKLKILLYHSVPDNFEKQMKYLSKNYTIISLKEAINLIKEKKCVKGRVVITFDDGFKEVYKKAFPVLKKENIPAIIFLTTGFIDHKPLFLHKLKFAHPSIRKVFESASKEQIEGLYLKRCSRIEASQKPLTWQEIKDMKKHNIRFGAHGVYHLSLAYQKPAVIESQIRNSKKIIDKRLNQNTRIFAYPYGHKESFNQQVIDCLKENGFVCSLARGEDFNDWNTDLFHLQRVSIEKKDSMIDFYNKLAGFAIHRVRKKVSFNREEDKSI